MVIQFRTASVILLNPDCGENPRIRALTSIVLPGEVIKIASQKHF